jgi:hypothetical protein
MTPKGHRSAVIEFPSDLEIVTTREFDAPIEVAFDVLTNREHVRNEVAHDGVPHHRPEPVEVVGLRNDRLAKGREPCSPPRAIPRLTRPALTWPYSSRYCP